MRTTLSASRWIFLLTLAVAMLFSASQGHILIHFPCCYGGILMIKEPIEKCFQQEPGSGCNTSAYLVKPLSGQWQCIKKDSKWLKKKLLKGELHCPSVISKRRFEVLDNDVE